MIAEQEYLVAGFWAETAERWSMPYLATSPRTAEDQAQMDAAGTGGTLRVCRVIPGGWQAADLYTAYVDPSDPRNADRDDLEADTPDFTRGGDPEWTVFGFAVPRGCQPADPRLPVRGERYGDVVNATSAGAAEDVARDRVRDRGGDLLVCIVLAGRVAAADTYAVFCDPDIRAAG